MVKKIVHLADIHIRTLRLHDEYKDVFKSLMKDVKELISGYEREEVRIVPRASFEVSAQCPREYKLIIAECIGKGWLKPVAHMRDVEYTMELLRQ